MKTLKGPGIFLAQYAGDAAPFNTLPDIALEVTAHEGGGGLTGTEAGEPHPVLKRFRDFGGLGLNCFGGNRNLELVLTAFH